MSDQKERLREEIHFRVLRLLENNPAMSQRELAAAVGVSAGGIHYILKALIERGFVKLGRFAAAEDKRRYAYVLTSQGMREKAAIARIFLARKLEEYELLRQEIAMMQAEQDAEKDGVRL